MARWAHNPKVAGSNPAPATNIEGRKALISFRLRLVSSISPSSLIRRRWSTFGQLLFHELSRNRLDGVGNDFRLNVNVDVGRRFLIRMPEHFLDGLAI